MDELAVTTDDRPITRIVSKVVCFVFPVSTDDRIVILTCATDGHLSGTAVGIEHLLAVHLVPVTDTGHLAAAEDGAVDARITADVDLGVGYTTGQDVIIVLNITLARAEDVAHALVAAIQQGIANRITDATATDIDGGQTVADVGAAHGIVSLSCDVWITILIHTDEGQTATAEDGALDGATTHGDIGVATHATAVLIDMEGYRVGY